VASLYIALITFVHNRHFLSKDTGLSAKFENYPGLIAMTLRRLVTMISNKTQLHMALRLDIHNRGQTRNSVKGKASPFTGLDRPRGFQEVKVSRFRDNGTGWW